MKLYGIINIVNNWFITKYAEGGVYNYSYMAVISSITYWLMGGVAHWVARLTCNVEYVGLSPIKRPRFFHDQDTVPLYQLHI